VSKGLAFLKSATVALAMVGIVFPQTRILADQKNPAKPVIKTVAANSVLDVSLGKDGTFTGRAVTANGTPVEGAEVVVKQGNAEVAHSVTDKNGQFAMSNLKVGAYQVKSGNTEGMVRLWTEQTAPPSAKPHGLLVLGDNGSRGQWGCYDDCGGCMLCAAIGTLGLGVGIATLILANQAKQAADDNSAAIAALAAKVASP
jgi:hypothetical protein